MPLDQYADELQAALDAGDPPLDGLTIPEFKAFIAWCRELAEKDVPNVQ